MQPTRTPRRRIAMKVLLAVPVALVALVTACGGEGTTLADPPGPSSSPSSGSSSGSGSGSPSPTPEQSQSPSSDDYPAYAPQDYRYTLVVSCFCMDGGVPIDIRVEDGEVTEAVYAGDGRGVEKGTDAEEFRRLTINDVIAAADDPRAETVRVVWPEGQGYPTTVSIDRSSMVADDEITYDVSAVRVTQ